MMNGHLPRCFVLLMLLHSSTSVRSQTAGKDAKAAAKELSSLLETVRAKHDVPALAAGVVHLGEAPRTAVVGVRKRGFETRVSADDQFHLGSNSKPFTAFLIALLIDLGLLDWDTPLEQIFPEHAGKWHADLKKITPAHLLTHSSGLPAEGPLKQFMKIHSQKTPVQDRAKLMKDLADVELAAKPGEKYEYSNLGFTILGAIADRRGKSPWEDQIKKRIGQPLGIKHWSLGSDVPGAKLLQPFPHKPDGEPIPTTGVIDNPGVMNSANRIRISVGDYCKFLAETAKLARGEKGLLKPATARKFFTSPYPASRHSLSAWIGFRKTPDAKGLIIGHDGSNTLNYVTAMIFPDESLAICVMCNQGSPGGPGGRACLEVGNALRSKAKR